MEQMRLSIRRGDSVERAITTVASLVVAQDSDNILKTQSTAMPNDPLSQEIGSSDRPRRQDTTLRGADAQTRHETASKMSRNPPLLEVNTSGHGEDNMEYHDDLTDFVPPTPHVSPLSGGNTPGSDEGRMELIQELMETYTSLTKGSFLRGSKDSKKRGRNDDKIEELNLTDRANTEVIVEDKGSGEKGGSTADQVSTGRPESTKRRQKKEEATSACIAEDLNEIQARIDAEHEMAKQLATERAEAIRNKPPTRTQVRNKMITYLKHIGKYTHQQLKHKNFEEVQKLYEREKKWIDAFKPIDDDSQQQAKSTKKRPRAYFEEESSKKQKLEEDNNAEKEELRDSMDVVTRDDVAIDVESLATKYPISKLEIVLTHVEFYIDDTGVAIHMMIEKKYPLTQDMLARMLNKTKLGEIVSAIEASEVTTVSFMEVNIAVQDVLLLTFKDNSQSYRYYCEL
ncbi:hypothetical protein Tco_1293001 [Tanacetum coccineum]